MGTARMKILISTALLGALTMGTVSAYAANNYYDTMGLKELLQAKIVILEMGGVLTYYHNGEYHYKLKNKTFRGTWKIGDGEVCVVFSDNRRRCNRFGNDNGIIYYENAKGNRYEVKEIQDTENEMTMQTVMCNSREDAETALMAVMQTPSLQAGAPVTSSDVIEALINKKQCSVVSITPPLTTDGLTQHSEGGVWFGIEQREQGFAIVFRFTNDLLNG